MSGELAVFLSHGKLSLFPFVLYNLARHPRNQVPTYGTMLEMKHCWPTPFPSEQDKEGGLAQLQIWDIYPPFDSLHGTLERHTAVILSLSS